jgi:hypothetical protein
VAARCGLVVSERDSPLREELCATSNITVNRSRAPPAPNLVVVRRFHTNNTRPKWSQNFWMRFAAKFHCCRGSLEFSGRNPAAHLRRSSRLTQHVITGVVVPAPLSSRTCAETACGTLGPHQNGSTDLYNPALFQGNQFVVSPRVRHVQRPIDVTQPLAGPSRHWLHQVDHPALFLDLSVLRAEKY